MGNASSTGGGSAPNQPQQSGAPMSASPAAGDSTTGGVTLVPKSSSSPGQVGAGTDDSQSGSAPILAAVPEDKYALNPGTNETLHNKVKDLFPTPFDGGKLVVNKPLSNHFQASHTVVMSSIDPSQSGYKYGITFVGTKKYSESEVYPILLGEFSPAGGDLNGQIIHQPAEQWRVKLVSQLKQGKNLATQLTNEFRWPKANLAVTVANVDLEHRSGTVVADYMHTVFGRHAVGGMAIVGCNPRIPGGYNAVLGLGARLAGDKWQLNLSATPLHGSFHASYLRKLTNELQLVSDWEVDLSQRASLGNIGYQWEMPKSGFTFKARIDTEWVVAATMEKKLAPFPFTFALSGLAHQVKHQYRFGIGLVFQ
ncbi:hypothetical protein BOX15_Mlig009767g1 [Macrostomum lignano]|uniref:Mitochondrial import receptor subunit TOM40 homolog n=1 Tax=Macrostomum lignano TaxID=282301 RepID=A0A267G392_9PLAT|nr:hypothetical protein BOX15_Mlig009767g1 [Macrostomum lignano]